MILRGISISKIQITKMTQEELIQEIKDDISASCSLPYNLNDDEIIRIINRAKAWMYDN